MLFANKTTGSIHNRSKTPLKNTSMQSTLTKMGRK